MPRDVLINGNLSNVAYWLNLIVDVFLIKAIHVNVVGMNLLIRALKPF